jgi:cytochrome c
MGRSLGAVDGFKYSRAFAEASQEGRVWTIDELAAFLKKPKAYIKGTKMSFAGLKNANDIEAIIAYLASYSEQSDD